MLFICTSLKHFIDTLVVLFFNLKRLYSCIVVSYVFYDYVSVLFFLKYVYIPY